MQKPFASLIRVFMSLALIALALFLFRDKLPDVVAGLRAARLWLVLVAILIFWTAMTINALKWWILLRAQTKEVPFRALVNYTFVGFFFNNLLPANIGGDLMRGYGLARYMDRGAVAVASVMLDRLLGLAAYMSVATLASLVTVFLDGHSELSVLPVVATIAALSLLLLAAILLSRRVRRLVERVVKGTFLRRFGRIWDSLSLAFEVYRSHTKTLLIAFCVGLVGIASTSLLNFVLSESLGGGITLLEAFLFTPLIAMVLIIPISVGGVGLSQMAYPFFYGLVGIPAAHAFSMSVLMQAVQLFCSLPGGVLWIRWRRMPGDEAATPEPSHA
ncbi:MAG: UPF0104 family protein [Caldilineae bacterium]|nr:MAG: UPF0104 family protein [Caldilineae bacterium]